jgi:TolB-like protein/Tfp pilus assembly protein PilF
MSLIVELKRRNVFKVGAAYAVLAWLLAQVSDIFLENFGAPDWVIKTILLLLVIGFPLALFFAWAFELTPEGVKREKDVDRARSITHKTGKKLNRTIVVLLIAAVVYLVWDKLAYRTEVTQAPAAAPATQSPVAEPDVTAPADASIAVLPFANRSANQSDVYFTDGIHDDLLTHLARIDSMKVISRTSVLRYRDTEKPIPEIADELGVATVLEGGVQRAGSMVRINVQLIDADTDEHLWAEIYDRELSADNIFAIQSEIAQAIAAALQAELSDANVEELVRAPTSSTKAYDLYLRATGLMRDPDTDLEGYLQVETVLYKAVAEDPDYLEAWLALARTHGLLFWFGDPRQEQQKNGMLAAIDQAARIAADDPRVLAIRGMYQYRVEKDYETALAFIEPAIAHMPNDLDLSYMSGLVNRRLGRWEASLADFARAAQLDPGNALVQKTLATTATMAGQPDRAIEHLLKLVQRFPDEPQFRISLAGIEYSHRGNYLPGLELIKDGNIPASSDLIFIGIQSLWASGDRQGAIDLIANSAIPGSPMMDMFLTTYQAALLRFTGKQQESRSLAAETLGRLDAFANKNEQLLEVTQFQLILSMAAALAGETERALELRSKFLAAAMLMDDPIERNDVLEIMAVVLAMAGDTHAAWEELKAVIGKPNGTTLWELKLDPGNEYLFGDIREYRELVAGLDAEGSK